MVNNILIEVMGAMAEQERKKTRERQREGLNRHRQGVCEVRRPKEIITGLDEMVKKYKAGLVTVTDACKRLGISRSQWYRRVCI